MNCSHFAVLLSEFLRPRCLLDLGQGHLERVAENRYARYLSGKFVLASAYGRGDDEVQQP